MGAAVGNHKEIGVAVEDHRFFWNTFVLRILSFLYYFNMLLHLFFGAGYVSLWNDNFLQIFASKEDGFQFLLDRFLSL